MLEISLTPCSTSTSPGSARLCASISAMPETPPATACGTLAVAATFITVRARPTSRAFASVGFSTSDWVRNIQARPDEEVTIGIQHFAASHRFLREDEAVAVIRSYEHRNRFIAPIVRAGFSWLVGWKYRSTDDDRRRLASQIPLLAFLPRS